MIANLQTALKPPPKADIAPTQVLHLQRKCACGGSSSDDCECGTNGATLVDSPGGHDFGRIPLQPKLTVSTPGDPYEREADRVADAVAASWDAPVAQNGFAGAPLQVQRQVCSIADQQIPLESKEADESERVRPEEEETPAVSEVSEGFLQRACSPASAASATPGGSIRDLLAASSSGHPLPAGIGEQMGQRMNADFTTVRIHTDSHAAAMNRAIGARAFTYGRDIFFNRGELDPHSRDGRHLLAHELTHTLQQNGADLKRLKVTAVGALTKAACGGYAKKWDFELAAAAADDGYLVQQVDYYQDEKNCPAFGQCLANPTLTFWEAWPVKKGDTFHEKHAAGYTDGSGSPGKDKAVGYVAAIGEIKFFTKKTTGDLGTYNTAPATANGGWAPNASGQSKALPSTLTQPKWWTSAPVDGPAKRSASASWRCCHSADDFNTIDAKP